MVFWLAVTAMSVAALVAAERAEARSAVWVFKPIASLAFVATALRAGALSTSYGRCIAAALVLGMLGDVLLIPRSSRTFLFGLGSFLLGHLMFAVAFCVRGVSWGWTAAMVLPAVAVGAGSLRWLGPHIPAAMRRPVLAYVTVICAMLALSVGVSARDGRWLVALGAAMFCGSDVSVARDRFVKPGFANRLWGLPLYYAAQIALALTVQP